MGIFNTTVTGKRSTNSQDAKGFGKRNWATATTICSAVPASIQKMSSREIQAFGVRGLDVDFDIFTRTNTALRKGDRAIEDSTNTQFEVVDNEDMAGRGKMYRLACKRTA
jgi:hypothetical protein